MVRIIEGKLVIECENLGSQTANLAGYQSAIIDVLQNYTEDSEDKTTAYYLGMLLTELMPTLEQNEALYKVESLN